MCSESAYELYKEPDSFYNHDLKVPLSYKPLHKGRLYEIKEAIYTPIRTPYLALVNFYGIMKGGPLFPVLKIFY